MTPTPIQKLRVFAPQIVAFVACDAFASLAVACNSSHVFVAVQATIAAMATGMFTIFTTIGKAVEVFGAYGDGWSKYLPAEPTPCPNCASMAVEHRKALAEVAELREALATLRLPE